MAWDHVGPGPAQGACLAGAGDSVGPRGSRKECLFFFGGPCRVLRGEASERMLVNVGGSLPSNGPMVCWRGNVPARGMDMDAHDEAVRQGDIRGDRREALLATGNKGHFREFLECLTRCAKVVNGKPLSDARPPGA